MLYLALFIFTFWADSHFWALAVKEIVPEDSCIPRCCPQGQILDPSGTRCLRDPSKKVIKDPCDRRDSFLPRCEEEIGQNNNQLTVSKKYTETRKNMNLPYSIRMYWTDFWQPTAVHVQQNIFETTLREVGSSHLRFFKHLLCPNCSIIRGTAVLWKMYENGKIAVFEGKLRRFRILSKV